VGGINAKIDMELPSHSFTCHSSRINHDWPDEEKVNYILCGASFLARTAAETGRFAGVM
jgi:hypothetical protein